MEPLCVLQADRDIQQLTSLRYRYEGLPVRYIHRVCVSFLQGVTGAVRSPAVVSPWHLTPTTPCKIRHGISNIHSVHLSHRGWGRWVAVCSTGNRRAEAERPRLLLEQCHLQGHGQAAPNLRRHPSLPVRYSTRTPY